MPFNFSFVSFEEFFKLSICSNCQYEDNERSMDFRALLKCVLLLQRGLLQMAPFLGMKRCSKRSERI